MFGTAQSVTSPPMNFERSRPSLAQSMVSKVPSAQPASAVWVSTSTTSQVTEPASTMARILAISPLYSASVILLPAAMKGSKNALRWLSW